MMSKEAESTGAPAAFQTMQGKFVIGPATKYTAFQLTINIALDKVDDEQRIRFERFLKSLYDSYREMSVGTEKADLCSSPAGEAPVGGSTEQP